MSLRLHVASSTAAVLALGAFAASAPAASGGAAAPTVIPVPAAPTVTLAPVAPTAQVVGNPVATASANGLTVAARATAMLRHCVHVRGIAARRARAVQLQRLDARRGWVAVAAAAVRADRTFDVVWRPDRTGPLQVRAVPAATAIVHATTRPARAGSAPQLAVTVYRSGVATWYGPKDNGGPTTACRVKLTKTTLGVAHRTLPCGTPVALWYRGRSIIVPVIDRGPFVRGVTWDLTEATNTALGGDGRISIGALPLVGRLTFASLPGLVTALTAPAAPVGGAGVVG